MEMSRERPQTVWGGKSEVSPLKKEIANEAFRRAAVKKLEANAKKIGDAKREEARKKKELEEIQNLQTKIFGAAGVHKAARPEDIQNVSEDMIVEEEMPVSENQIEEEKAA